MAPAVGNADKTQLEGYREKMMVSFEVPNVDEAYQSLKAKGIDFINEPTDMPVEEIEDELMRHIRQLDKMIDELAKGKPMEKILRI